MTPSGVIAVVGAIASVAAFVRRPVRRRRTSWQFVLSMASWGLLWFAGASTFAREGMSSLPIHMIGHIIVMFLVPMGLIASGTARSWWWLLGVNPRRRLLSWWYRGRRAHVPSWLVHPLTAALVLNVVMVAAHTPAVFDWVMEANWRMDWLMEPAFLLSGLFFFHFLVTSPPRRNHVRLRYQLFMVAVTMLEMLVMAMAMSIFTRTSWYSVMDPVPGMADMPGMGMHASTFAQAFHQQQLAAAILWICGDFWAVPCLVVIVRRLVTRDGSLLASLDRQSARFSGSAT